MSRTIGFAVLAMAVTALSGCQTSRGLTTRTALMSVNRPITVYSEDHQTYTLREHVLVDSVIQGSGTVYGDHKTAAFEGSIPLTSIRAVKTSSTNVLKGLAVLGVTAMFVAAVSDDDGHRGPMQAVEDRYRVYPNSGGGGGGQTSCPYVYAWNGQRYVLEAEPFGVALGRGLELTTVHLLPSARAENGVVRLLLTNERRETHYVNSLRLMAIDLGDAPAAVLDAEGRAWPLGHLEPPLTASDGSDRDIRSELATADGRMWECDPSRLAPGSGYEDVLDLTFVRPPRAAAGSLVLSGINTAFSSAMYGQLYRAVEDPVTMAHAIDTDPELIARLKDYLVDASLKATVWDGHRWVPAGAFQPEANAVTFTRALRLRVADGAGDTVRVRLRGMADVWKIDAIAADWTDAPELPMTPVKLLSAVGPDGEDLAPLIGADDTHYAVLLPPDRVELNFAAPAREAGARVAYAVAGRGYLHEWDPENAAAGTESVAWAPGERRLDLVKELLKHREIALRPAYEEWRAVRGTP
jgi:hypothetical protein